MNIIIIQGVPEKMKLIFNYLLLKNCSTRIHVYIPVFRYIIFPHLCKITAQLLLYILRYCIKTEDTLFSFSPRNWIFTHFSNKTTNPFCFNLFIHLFIYIYVFIYLFNFGKEFLQIYVDI